MRVLLPLLLVAPLANSCFAAADADKTANDPLLLGIKERAAWEAFAKSLNTEAFAKDFPGPLRDLNSGDNRKVQKALNVLGASGAIEAIPFLVPFLGSPDRETSLYAGLSLERIVSSTELQRRDMNHPDRIVLRPRTPQDPDLTPLRWVVRTMLMHKDEPSVLAYAATMAAYIGLADLEKELRGLLSSRHPAVTRSAAHALRTLGLTVEWEPHPIGWELTDRAEPPAGRANKHPDLARFGLEFVEPPAELYERLQKAVAAMKLEFKGKENCETIEKAWALLGRSISIPSTFGRVCTEHAGFFLFSGLGGVERDDRSFKSGFAVKKGTAEIHGWSVE